MCGHICDKRVKRQLLWKAGEVRLVGISNFKRPFDATTTTTAVYSATCTTVKVRFAPTHLPPPTPYNYNLLLSVIFYRVWWHHLFCKTVPYLEYILFTIICCLNWYNLKYKMLRSKYWCIQIDWSCLEEVFKITVQTIWWI